MKRALRATLYLWSLPYGLVGLLAALLFWVAGWVEAWRWEDGALNVVCRGPFARWMNRPREVVSSDGGPVEIRRWNAFTLAWTMLFWCPPEAHTVKHERRHVEQGLWLGVFFPPCWGLLTAGFGYHGNQLERDAREAAGQDDV